MPVYKQVKEHSREIGVDNKDVGLVEQRDVAVVRLNGMEVHGLVSSVNERENGTEIYVNLFIPSTSKKISLEDAIAKLSEIYGKKVEIYKKF